ncbi:MAG TPA: FliA/WhiG family RNA polymerase sigma factor [Candidatus Sumerlaeota bacterium]|nr:FliA/WhiG family RNA polymerase sigma factor [Candidatus Sumerlaeota bacterium]
MSGAVTYAPAKGRRRKIQTAAPAVAPVQAEDAAPPVKPKAKVKTPRTAYAEAAKTSLEARNEMIVEYLPLVKFVASRIASRLPSHIELNDLINSGIIGLIDAIEKFDASRKIKFKTYAEFRIKGAILDELRALDWVPRSTRQKASRLERAYAELEQMLGRAASDAEMMEFLGISLEEFDQLVREARGVALISLDELQGGDHDENFERNLLEYLADPEHMSPAQVMNLDQVYKIVADAIDQLPEKERLVISLYYYEELTMKEIGEILSITESRVSQIHTKAILRLRGRLTKLLGD